MTMLIGRSGYSARAGDASTPAAIAAAAARGFSFIGSSRLVWFVDHVRPAPLLFAY
jgi:hypothetical protein